MKSQGTLRLALALFVCQTGSLLAAAAHSPTDDMAEAADHFLAALTPEQKKKATYEFKDNERLNWHFIPKTRNGLPLKEMNPTQQHLANALLSSALSQRGFIKAQTIMSLEAILKELEASRTGTPTRDPELYFFTIFGKPGDKKAWAWRFEGHHVAMNFTIVNGNLVAGTPSFLGSNPAEVKTGPRKGLRVLAAEEDIARQLVQSLTEEQKKVAIYTNSAPKDIITGTNRTLNVLQPMGVSMAKMTKAQADLASALIEEYVRRTRPEIADKELEALQHAGWEKVYFAWAGSLEPGKGHYYRVQGPTFLLEYDCTQDNANHIHAVWRDLKNDFAEDLLRKHYDEHQH